ncbi:MAG: DUF4230 domain-containing protein [Lachnospiraceae bacterium]|nr:DUF4230 domain-containing protein [Lachnospiraceae bacterium]
MSNIEENKENKAEIKESASSDSRKSAALPFGAGMALGIGLGVGIILTVGVVLVVGFIKNLKSPTEMLMDEIPEVEDKQELDIKVLQDELTNISELAVLSTQYSNAASFSDAKEIQGWEIPLTESKFVITYDGEIKAGVDMEEVIITVEDNIVDVTLPEAEILSHEIDPNSVQVLDEKSSIFNPISVGDFAQFEEDQKEIMEKKYVEQGLLLDAHDRAEDFIKKLFETILPEGYIVNVH